LQPLFDMHHEVIPGAQVLHAGEPPTSLRYPGGIDPAGLPLGRSAY
jgi:hypothetical protein